MKINKNNKGFTLVEIVIVLAIAALILAAILFAIQGAQQSRRDAARRDAAGQIGALMEEYAGNHNGTYPTTNAQMSTQIAQRTEIPNGGEYTFGVFNSAGVASCPAPPAVTNQVILNTAGRQWQVCMGLESQDWFRANN